ncbi:hypothetical protein AWC38_SpisGene1449 [Stylophora pistillata]|uniref:Uncharacterized protein n=1 Tax=Stylophora pistillata TaxID=50429 RepID=A0A2B4SX36_STYPI|nr:hypothetical protein AWC38_SpisGene1449 [Stylophora pistillata]
MNTTPSSSEGLPTKPGGEVANEKGPSPERKPSLSSVTKDDDEARHSLVPYPGDSNYDQKTKEKRKKRSEKVDGNDETISPTINGLDVVNEECLKIPLQDGNPSSSSVAKDDERSTTHTNEDGFTANQDQVAWSLCDLAEDLNSQPDIFDNDEAFHRDIDRDIDWFHPSIASNSVWPSNHESYEAESEHYFFSSDEEIEIGCQSIIILDQLLLYIFKVFGEQSMEVECLEIEVFDRTGCNFSTLHDKQVDLTGCWRSSRSHLTNARNYQVVGYLDPSFILISSNPAEGISGMLSSGHSFPLKVGGWSILHSAVLIGSKELVEEILAYEENIGFSSDENTYINSDYQFQTSLELAIVLHRCDIIDLFKEKIHFIKSISPSRLIQLCFLPQHGIRSFDHPIEILTSDKDTLQVIRNLHDHQDCSLIELLQIFLREFDIDYTKELLKSFLQHLEECAGLSSCFFLLE